MWGQRCLRFMRSFSLWRALFHLLHCVEAVGATEVCPDTPRDVSPCTVRNRGQPHLQLDATQRIATQRTVARHVVEMPILVGGALHHEKPAHGTASAISSRPSERTTGTVQVRTEGGAGGKGPEVVRERMALRLLVRVEHFWCGLQLEENTYVPKTLPHVTNPPPHPISQDRCRGKGAVVTQSAGVHVREGGTWEPRVVAASSGIRAHGCTGAAGGG